MAFNRSPLGIPLSVWAPLPVCTTWFTRRHWIPQMRRDWVTALTKAKSDITPEMPMPAQGQGHRCMVKTFAETLHCSQCNLLLWGLINQGFECKGCGKRCHKSCLTQFGFTCVGLWYFACMQMSSAPIVIVHVSCSSRSAACKSPAPPLMGTVTATSHPNSRVVGRVMAKVPAVWYGARRWL